MVCHAEEKYNIKRIKFLTLTSHIFSCYYKKSYGGISYYSGWTSKNLKRGKSKIIIIQLKSVGLNEDDEGSEKKKSCEERCKELC